MNIKKHVCAQLVSLCFKIKKESLCVDKILDIYINKKRKAEEKKDFEKKYLFGCAWCFSF